jgi:hypothetical protein
VRGLHARPLVPEDEDPGDDPCNGRWPEQTVPSAPRPLWPNERAIECRKQSGSLSPHMKVVRVCIVLGTRTQ